MTMNTTSLDERFEGLNSEGLTPSETAQLSRMLNGLRLALDADDIAEDTLLEIQENRHDADINCGWPAILIDWSASQNG